MHKQKVSKLESRKLNFPKSDSDGVYIWLQNRLLRGRGSERPAAQTQQILTQVAPFGIYHLQHFNILLMEIEQGIRRLKKRLANGPTISFLFQEFLLQQI